MILGKRIRELRLQSGRTQEALAHELGVSMMTVSRWERDQHKPSLNELGRLAEALGVTAADLLSENGQPA